MAALTSFSRQFFAACRLRLASTGASNLKTELRAGAQSVSLAASSIYRNHYAIASSRHKDTDQNAEVQIASQSQELPACVGLQTVRELLPGTTNHLTASMQPFVQSHNAARDAEEEEIYMNVLRSCPPQPLLKLPDEALHLVATHLPPTCAAQLQKTCKHMYTLLDEERIWQDRLGTLHPYWLDAGIQPSQALQHGQTWKQLLLSASQLRNHQGSYANPGATSLEVCNTTQTVWAAGSVPEVDFHLCWAEFQSARASLSNPVQVQLITQNVNNLLDLVHFLWFDQRQLARGAACLARAISLLTDQCPVPISAQQQLQPSNSDVIAAFQTAGAYLVELLEMRVWQHTIMTIKSAQGFHRACILRARGHAVTLPSSQGPILDWFGNQYSWDDLRGALAAVADAHTPPAHLIPQGYEDPLYPPTWHFLNPKAASLLEALNGSAIAAAAQDNIQGAPGLLATDNSQDAVKLLPYDACSAHHKQAGTILLARMASHWRWWQFACAHARMWLAAKQPLRAAHVAKMCLAQMPDNEDASAWALELAAEAYYQHWKQTGTADSFRMALLWLAVAIFGDRAQVRRDSPRAVVHRLFGPRTKIIELLQDRMCLAVLSLPSAAAQLLVVGACASALWRAGCASPRHNLLSKDINLYQMVVRNAQSIFTLYLKGLCKSSRARWDIKHALSYVPGIKPASHPTAAAELAQKVALAEHLAEAEAAPFARVLLDSMQSLCASVTG